MAYAPERWADLSDTEGMTQLRETTVEMAGLTHVLRRHGDRRPRRPGARLRRADRLASPLMRRWGWSYGDIAYALTASESAVRRYLVKIASEHKVNLQHTSNLTVTPVVSGSSRWAFMDGLKGEAALRALVRHFLEEEYPQ